MLDFIKQPWPWYVAGPFLGLTVPILLIAGNKTFGISSSLRHVCASCIPAGIPFFKYNWRKEAWNLFFVVGIVLGGVVAAQFFHDPARVVVNPDVLKDLEQYGISNIGGLVPVDIFSWPSLLTVRGLVMMIAGGFLVGFGSRYAGGCTSGHAIMGLSSLQWPSLVATCCFMIGGFIMANLILPFILAL